jgi:23S rRNA (guanosine2251-2'-O)-methyltransferase
MKEEGNQIIQEPTPELAWGRNSVLALIEEAPKRIKKILIARDSHHQAIRKVEEYCRRDSIPYQKVERASIERFCPGAAHQGVVALVSPVEMLDAATLGQHLPPNPIPAMVLLLDHLQDPGNLGSIIRSAESFGASAIVIPKRRAALPTGIVLKASAGAAARLPVFTAPNLLFALDQLEPLGFWSVGLDHEALEPLDGKPLPERLALVVGGEGQGISRPVEMRCDERRRIPMAGKSGSLNASVATAIAMYEWKRMIDKAGSAP